MAEGTSTRWLHPGFTRDSVLDYLFKKSIHRVDTSLKTSYYQEEFGKNNLFLDYLATDVIPPNPPTDFVKLTNSQIATLFAIHESEVDDFNSYLNGENVFSIEQSQSCPHILRINNLLMRPNIRNINGLFTGMTGRTRVNLISSAIHGSFGNGKYTCELKRTGIGGELSLGGHDVVSIHTLAYIFDGDNGYLKLHEPDSRFDSPNPISSVTPPVFSCYIYRGNYGRLGWQVENNAIILKESQLLLGKTNVTNPTLIMDVSGAAFIDDLTVRSVTTFSDIRLKENILPAPVNYKILDLNPVYYNYKGKSDVKEYGLIAQEVHRVAPELVKEGESYLSVHYDRIGVQLLPIIKQQQERISALEARLAELIEILVDKRKE